MSRYADQSNPNTIKRWTKEGRGSGDGRYYKPWLHPADFSSEGHSSRAPGWKTGRLHHLLSRHELEFFYNVDASSLVADIKEQFPLCLQSTQAIATSFNLQHPRGIGPITLTTDFLLILTNGQKQARTVKPFSKLASKRVWEKFEIERIYWEMRGVDWGIVTEREISTVLFENIQALHDCYDLTHQPRLNKRLVEHIGRDLLPKVIKGDVPLIELTTELDDKLGLPLSTCLAAVKHLIATRVWLIDLHQPFNPSSCLILSGHPDA